jgi:hypothetical protein
MDINWEAAIGNPVQGELIYIEQSYPARCFVGRVILVWRNEHERDVITVVTENADAEVVNLGPDDRWVSYRNPPVSATAVEIASRYGECVICHAPIFRTASGTVYHPWLWLT